MIDIKYHFPPENQIDDVDLSLLLVCDQGYFKYLQTLLRSIRIFSPGVSVWVHMINPNEETRLLLSSYPAREINLNFSYEITELSLYCDDFVKTYYACARFILLPRVLEAAKSLHLLVMDVDALVVGPLSTEYSAQAADVALFERNHTQDERMKIAAGIVGIKNNKNGLTFSTALSTKLKQAFQSKQATWYLDQVTLHEMAESYRHKIKIKPIKAEFLDWRFTRSSVIWSAKGDRKDEAGQYLYLANILNFLGEEKENAHFLKHLVAKFEKTQAGQDKKVLMLLPRFDLNWKRDAPKDRDRATVNLTQQTLDLRLRWQQFISQLAAECEKRGLVVDIKCMPAWEIAPHYIDTQGYGLAVIPHQTAKEFCYDTPTLFYMQEYFRWVFTIDPEGWSALSSQYPVILNEHQPEQTQNSFKQYQTKILTGQILTKFKQCETLSLKRRIYNLLTLQTRLTLNNFILCPIQIPHDQSIQLNADIEMEELISQLASWCQQQKIKLVLKPHPANIKLTRKFKTFVDNQTVHWRETDIYDLIKQSLAVYTINSGAGFEALFFEKPVVTFGRAEYDCATHQGSLQTLDAAFEYVKTFHKNKKPWVKKYERFINWFLQDYAVDLSDVEASNKRLGEIAETILKRFKTSNKNSSEATEAAPPLIDEAAPS